MSTADPQLARNLNLLSEVDTGPWTPHVPKRRE